MSRSARQGCPARRKPALGASKIARQIIGSVCSCEAIEHRIASVAATVGGYRVEPDAQNRERGAETGEAIDDAAGQCAGKHDSDLF